LERLAHHNCPYVKNVVQKSNGDVAQSLLVEFPISPGDRLKLPSNPEDLVRNKSGALLPQVLLIGTGRRTRRTRDGDSLLHRYVDGFRRGSAPSSDPQPQGLGHSTEISFTLFALLPTSDEELSSGTPQCLAALLEIAIALGDGRMNARECLLASGLTERQVRVNDV
jgi:hypothetical protein